MSNCQVINDLIARIAGADVKVNGDEVIASWEHTVLKWKITDDRADLVSIKRYNQLDSTETMVFTDCISYYWKTSDVRFMFCRMPIDGMVESAEGDFKFVEPRGCFYAKPLTDKIEEELDDLVCGVLGADFENGRTTVSVIVEYVDGNYNYCVIPRPSDPGAVKESIKAITGIHF